MQAAQGDAQLCCFGKISRIPLRQRPGPRQGPEQHETLCRIAADNLRSKAKRRSPPREGFLLRPVHAALLAGAFQSQDEAAIAAIDAEHLVAEAVLPGGSANPADGTCEVRIADKEIRKAAKPRTLSGRLPCMTRKLIGILVGHRFHHQT